MTELPPGARRALWPRFGLSIPVATSVPPRDVAMRGRCRVASAGVSTCHGQDVGIVAVDQTIRCSHRLAMPGRALVGRGRADGLG